MKKLKRSYRAGHWIETTNVYMDFKFLKYFLAILFLLNICVNSGWSQIEITDVLQTCSNGDGAIVVLEADASSLPFRVQWYNESNSDIGEEWCLTSPCYIPDVTEGTIRFRAYLTGDEEGQICYNDLYTDINLEEPSFEILAKLIEPDYCDNGIINVQVSNTITEPFSIQWQNDDGVLLSDYSGLFSLEGLVAGVYCARVEDRIGCVVSECFEVLPASFEPMQILLDFNGDRCQDAPKTVTARVEPAIYGNQGLYWNGITVAREVVMEDLEAGIYEISATTFGGCKVIRDFEISSNVEVVEITPSCPGVWEGKIVLQINNPIIDEKCRACAISVDYGFRPCGECAPLPIVNNELVSSYTLTIDDLEGGRTYSVFVQTNGCARKEYRITVPDDGGVKSNIRVQEVEDDVYLCVYDVTCNGVVLEDISEFAVPVDIPNDQCPEEERGSCGCFGFYCGNEIVGYQGVGTKQLRYFEYSQLLSALGHSAETISFLLGPPTPDNLCNRYNVCLNDGSPGGLIDGLKGQSFINGWYDGHYYDEESGCLKVRCAIDLVFGKVNIHGYDVCGFDFLPPYLRVLYEDFYDDSPACTPVTYNLETVYNSWIAWANDPDVGSIFRNSTLNDFLRSLFNSDDRRRLCAKVTFCKESFRLLHTDINELPECRELQEREVSGGCIVRNSCDEVCVTADGSRRLIHCYGKYERRNNGPVEPPKFTSDEENEVSYVLNPDYNNSRFIGFIHYYSSGEYFYDALFSDGQGTQELFSSITDPYASTSNNVVSLYYDMDKDHVVQVSQSTDREVKIVSGAIDSGANVEIINSSSAITIEDINYLRDGELFMSISSKDSLAFGRYARNLAMGRYLLLLNRNGELIDHKQISDEIVNYTDIGDAAVIIAEVDGTLKSLRLDTSGIDVFGSGENNVYRAGENGELECRILSNDAVLSFKGQFLAEYETTGFNDGNVPPAFLFKSKVGYVGVLNFENEINVANEVYTSRGGTDILILELNDFGTLMNIEQYGGLDSEIVTEARLGSGAVFMVTQLSDEFVTQIGDIEFTNLSGLNQMVLAYYHYGRERDNISLRSRSFAEHLGYTLRPNPTSGRLTLSGISGDNLITASIFSVHGQLIKDTVRISEEGVIDVSDISAGVYFLSIAEDMNKTRVSIKFVKN